MPTHVSSISSRRVTLRGGGLVVLAIRLQVDALFVCRGKKAGLTPLLAIPPRVLCENIVVSGHNIEGHVGSNSDICQRCRQEDPLGWYRGQPFLAVPVVDPESKSDVLRPV